MTILVLTKVALKAFGNRALPGPSWGVYSALPDPDAAGKDKDGTKGGKTEEGSSS